MRRDVGFFNSKLKEKEMEIRSGISEIEKRKNSLFELKKYFYGDFKYNEGLKKVPRPNQLIQKAIECLENAIREAMEIEINSV